MRVTRVIVILVILGFCYGNQFDEDDINSRNSFVKIVEQILDKKDNGISAECNDHWNKYINALKKKNRVWALKMFDASAKIPSGILDGNFVDLGFFDECLSVEGASLSTTIYGKYCIGTLQLDGLTNKTENTLPIGVDMDLFQPSTRVAAPEQARGLQFGICTPKSCSAEELTNIYADIGLKLKFYDQLCQTKSDQPKLDAGGRAALWFLGIVLWIMLGCTTYDAILHCWNKKPAHPILIAFSVITNGKKLLKTSNSPSQISCLHGIRVISTMWVILAHRYVYQAFFPIRNYLYILEWMNDRANLFILNASLSVDTFFLMSGLVVAYIYMTAISKGVKFNVLLFYIHRYMRLTPVLAVIVLIHATLFKYFGSGPVFLSRVNPMLIQGCEQYWWKALLYIQNYGAQEATCIPQSWYLSVDTQLFFLSPIILLPLKRWPIPSLIITGILTVCSMVTSFLTAWFFELNASMVGNSRETSPDYMKWYYLATQTRAGPWLIGIVLGYYIFQVKQRKVRLTVNKGLILVVWAASLAVLCTCLFTGHNILFEEYNRVANSFHMALVRPAWAVALSWIIFACVIGYGGPVNWFLSLPVFQVLSKFTYTLYLLHLQVIMIITAQMRAPAIISTGGMMYVFWGDFVFTLALAVVFTLAFESPMITIEQVIFGKTKKLEMKPSEPEGVRYAEKSVENP